MTKRKSIAFILVLALVLSTVPAISPTSEVEEVEAATKNYAYLNLATAPAGVTEIYNEDDEIIVKNGSFISSGSAIDGVIISNTSDSGKYIVIKGDDSGNDGNVNVILSGASITSNDSKYAPISLTNKVTVNMKLVGYNKVISGGMCLDHAAIEVPTPNAITFSGYNGNIGSLYASKNPVSGAYGSAAIGGSDIDSTPSLRENGPITITKGASISAIYQAYNGYSVAAAAIGGAYGGVGSNIKITGGYVHAKSANGAGIGSGRSRNCKNIEITGGTVISESLNIAGTGCGEGAGIGSGALGSVSDIKISGGIVRATGYSGIGSGTSGASASNINISGGHVTAVGGSSAGIGGAISGDERNITISGGEVYATSVNGAGIGGNQQIEAKNINISGGVVTATSTYGAGIGGGKQTPVQPNSSQGSASNIRITGGFVNATSSSASGIGAGSYTLETKKPEAKEIFIYGGSVVANGPKIPIGTTPMGFVLNEPLKRVDIPLGNGINTGNQNLEFSIEGTTNTYKAKTVKNNSPNEHGEGYKYAATVYLPEGNHSLKVAGKAYGNIDVNSSGEAIVTRTVFDDPNSGNANNDGSTVSKPANVTKVYSPNKTFYLKKGKSMTLPVVASATDSKNPKLTWSTSNKKVVTVTQNGKITAKKKGKAKITVKADNGKNFVFTINVVTKDKKVTKISVKGYKKTMKKKQVKYLKVTPSPKTATNAKITFKSSKKSVLTVDKAGKITAKKKGKATITVKAGTKTKKIKITVK